MDIKKYIASGILEDYVLGLLNEQQRQEVEGYANQYPEIKSELQAIEEAMEVYGRIHAIQPPEGVEQQILKKIRTSSHGNSSTSPFNWLSILLALLFATAAIFAYNFYQKNTQAQQQITTLDNQLQQLQEDCDTIKAENERLINKILILQNPDYQPVDMLAVDTSKALLATVYWNAVDEESFLEFRNMPPPPSGQRYQLWAIVDGTPTDMGVLDTNLSAGLLTLVPFIDNPQAFAITLEDVNDTDPAPNLEQLQVIGNVS